MTDLRERQDKSTVRWDQLCDVIEASGGLTEVDSNQKWGQVLKELRVDASKIDQNSASVFRTWYLEKKRSRPESQKRWVARKTMVTEEAEVEQHLNSGTSASAAKARMAGHDVTSQVEVETVLRPRKLTERVYQQHLRNLKELFSNITSFVKRDGCCPTRFIMTSVRGVAGNTSQPRPLLNQPFL